MIKQSRCSSAITETRRLAARGGLAVALLAALLATSSQQAEAQPAPGPAALPSLSSSVHGSFLDAAGKPFVPSAELILATQDRLIAQLTQKLTPADRASLQKTRDALAGTKAEADRVWSNAILIGTLLLRGAPEDAPSLRSRNFALLSTYASLIGKHLEHDDIAAGKVPDWAQTPLALSRSPFDRAARIDLAGILLPPFRYTYSQRCVQAGVPAPPDWGSPNWVKVPAALQTSYLVQPGAFPHSLTHAYYYIPTKGPKGLCIALPIINDTTALYFHPGRIGRFPGGFFSPKYNALGIICQGLSTTVDTNTSNSHACFWDNNGDLWPGQAYPINSSAFLAPPNLPNDNQCTDCHAGENAFITHPGTAPSFTPSPIKIAKDNFNNAFPNNNFVTRNNWYKPLVQPGWPQNPEPGAYSSAAGPGTGTGTGICTDCHVGNFAGRLPSPAGSVASDRLFKFCNFLLPNELNQLPPPDPAHSPGQMASYVATHGPDVQALFNACKALFPPNPAATPANDPAVNIPPGFPANVSAWTQPVLPP